MRTSQSVAWGSRARSKLRVALDDEEAFDGRRGDQPGKQGEHVLAAVDVEVVRRGTEDEPRGLAQVRSAAEPEERVGRGDGGFRLDAQFGGSAAEGGGRGEVLLDEGRPDGPAAEGLPSQGPRSGEQVDGVFSPDGRAKEVEDRFADAVFHWTGAGIAGVVDLAAAKTSADDPHSRRLRLARRRFAAAALSFVHVHISPVCQTPVDMLPYRRRGEKATAARGLSPSAHENDTLQLQGIPS